MNLDYILPIAVCVLLGTVCLQFGVRYEFMVHPFLDRDAIMRRQERLAGPLFGIFWSPWIPLECFKEEGRKIGRIRNLVFATAYLLLVAAALLGIASFTAG